MTRSLAFHAPRLTGDLDIFIRSTAENAANVVVVLTEFGFADLRLKTSDFLASEQVIQLGRPPNRIDLLTSLTGVSDQAFSTKVSAKLDQLPVWLLSKALLIANKRAVSRPEDLADLAQLEE